MVHIPKKLHLDRRAAQIIELAAAFSSGKTPGYLLTDVELAALFGVSPQWPRNARIGGFGPPYKELSPRCIRYPIDEAITWLRTRPSITSTAESAHRKGNGAAPPAEQPVQPRRRKGEPTAEQRAEEREILLNIKKRKNLREGKTPVSGFKRGN